MRKTMVMMALTVAVAAHAGEKNDTTVIDNPGKVMIVTTDTVQTVTVTGRQGDQRYAESVPLNSWKMKKRKESKRDDGHDMNFDLGVGVNIPIGAPSEVNLRTFKSWEIFLGLRYCYTPKGKLQTYSAGLWLNWHNYGLKDSQFFDKDANGVIGVAEYPSNWSNRRSTLSVFSLSLPLLFTQRLGRGSKCKLTLGPVVNFNVYGRINNHYEQGDNEVDISTKGIGYRPVTIDLMGAFTYSKISLYVKYAPMNVLKKDRGPQFRSLTVGLYL